MLTGVRSLDESLTDKLLLETSGTADGEALRKALIAKREWPKTPEEAFNLQLNSSEEITLLARLNKQECYQRPVNIAYETKRSRRRSINNYLILKLLTWCQEKLEIEQKLAKQQTGN